MPFQRLARSSCVALGLTLAAGAACAQPDFLHRGSLALDTDALGGDNDRLLEPGESFDLACGYDAPWATLMQARALIEAGRIEEAAGRLESEQGLGPSLETVRAELIARIELGRRAMTQPENAGQQRGEESSRDAALRKWLERVRRWQTSGDAKR